MPTDAAALLPVAALLPAEVERPVMIELAYTSNGTTSRGRPERTVGLRFYSAAGEMVATAEVRLTATVGPEAPEPIRARRSYQYVNELVT